MVFLWPMGKSEVVRGVVFGIGVRPIAFDDGDRRKSGRHVGPIVCFPWSYRLGIERMRCERTGELTDCIQWEMGNY
jgi:hypothetical protein